MKSRGDGQKNYITPQGLLRLQTELKELKYKIRPEVTATVAWAASNGDRSENADYIYGKRRLREIDRRIKFLMDRLEVAFVVDPREVKSDQVRFGTRVTVAHESGEERTYRIVGVDETDVKNGDISWTSPLAKVLLNKKAGDVVTLKTPKGEDEVEILSIENG